MYAHVVRLKDLGFMYESYYSTRPMASCRLNGESLGVAFSNVSSAALLPTIGLHRYAVGSAVKSAHLSQSDPIP